MDPKREARWNARFSQQEQRQRGLSRVFFQTLQTASEKTPLLSARAKEPFLINASVQESRHVALEQAIAFLGEYAWTAVEIERGYTLYVEFVNIVWLLAFDRLRGHPIPQFLDTKTASLIQRLRQQQINDATRLEIDRLLAWNLLASPRTEETVRVLNEMFPCQKYMWEDGLIKEAFEHIDDTRKWRNQQRILHERYAPKINALVEDASLPLLDEGSRSRFQRCDDMALHLGVIRILFLYIVGTGREDKRESWFHVLPPTTIDAIRELHKEFTPAEGELLRPFLGSVDTLTDSSTMPEMARRLLRKLQTLIPENTLLILLFRHGK